MIARNSQIHPNKCAFVHGGIRTSFLNYRKLCDKYAKALIKDGIEVGDRVAIISNNNQDYMIVCGAAAKIGAIVVPINYRLNEEEIKYIIQDSSPKYIYSSEEYKGLALKLKAISDLNLRNYIFDMNNTDGCYTNNQTGLQNDEKIQSNITSNLPYMIIYTAAVTGFPRGCVLSQSNILVGGIQIANMFRLTAKDVHIGTLPLFHIGGFSMTMAVMHMGGKNVIIDRFDPSSILRLIENEKGTFFGTFPPMLKAILNAQKNNVFDVNSLRGVGGIDSSETITEFLEENPQASFFSLYGQTEVMPVSGCNISEKPGSIGLPAIMTRATILDDMDQDVAVGEQGEICVRSPAVFTGYWNLKTATKSTLRNGWHHTGDLGYVDNDGFLYFAGRKPEKELIKSGGENVYPAEVEEAILSHGAIDEVCVIGVPDPKWGEAVKALCVLKGGKNVSAKELQDYVSSKIARYKSPKYIFFVKSLPKEANGKINRKEVKKIVTQ